MRDVFALKLYTRVARLGSFSAAAREVGLSQPQASRIIADLEAELGARLLSRSTRRVTPTDAGAVFLSRIESILADLAEAEHDVREDGELRGMLRMSTPTSFGVHTLIPRLEPFMAKHPQLQVELLLEDRRQDLVRDAVDVAIRLGRLTDSSATSKLIARAPRVIVAAPSYLERAGVPKTPSDLAQHRIVGGSAAAVPSAWAFERDGETVKVEVQPHFVTNENEGVIAAAREGLGITSTNGWACQRDLDRGLLVVLLEDWNLAGIPIHAYFPTGAATRAAPVGK
jgi:DNA-binding transcriptional LysR family regulator